MRFDIKNGVYVPDDNQGTLSFIEELLTARDDSGCRVTGIVSGCALIADEYANFETLLSTYTKYIGEETNEDNPTKLIQKKKVKIFYGHLGAFSDDLESRINEFIKDKNVTDIQYRLSDGKHSVMIVYEEVN